MNHTKNTFAYLDFLFGSNRKRIPPSHYGFQIILAQIQFLSQLCDMHIDRPRLNRYCDIPCRCQQKVSGADMPGMVEQRSE